VLTIKLAEDMPAGTVTLAGTVAAVLELASPTAVPVCTVLVNMTRPVELLPPATELGFTLKEESAIGGAVPVEFISTYNAGLAPPTSKATSGLASPLKSLEMMKMRI
jgi:hypothetical protein